MVLTPAEVLGEGVLCLQGDSGMGKSTIGTDLAPILGAKFIETSHGLRGFTVLVQRLKGVHYLDQAACADVAKTFSFYVTPEGRVIVRGPEREVDVTPDLRSEQTDSQVAIVSSYKSVREAFVNAVRALADTRQVVVAGRHLPEIWPKAQCVLQVVRTDGVTEAARAQGMGKKAIEALAARSAQDRRNAEVALKGVEDRYTVLDTTGMTPAEQCTYALIHAFRAGFRIATPSETSKFGL